MGAGSELDITLTATPAGGSETIYALQVEELTVNIRRSPLQAAMPGADPVQVDMGFSDPSISIRGILPIVAGGTSGAAARAIIHKDLLEEIVTGAYANTITLTIGAGSGAISTSVYVGKIGDFSATLTPGKEEIYWTYRMTLLAQLRD